MKTPVVALALAACLAALHAQDQALSPSFEVASIRPNTSDEPVVGGSGGASIRQAGRRLTAVDASLREIIRYAYDLKVFETIAGESDVLDARFDLSALLPEANLGRDAALAMLRSLLAARFSLSARWSTREDSIYMLEVIPDRQRTAGGLRPSTTDCSNSETLRERLARREAPIEPDDYAREFLSPACDMVYQPYRARVYGGARTIIDLADLLSKLPELQSPVIDRTDLTGAFDFELVFDPGPRGRSTLGDDDALTAAPAPPLSVAIEEQLGQSRFGLAVVNRLMC
jgi:uncharacterized protein (TIGR03435 family)